MLVKTIDLAYMISQRPQVLNLVYQFRLKLWILCRKVLLDTSIAGTIASGTTDIQNILTMKLFYVRSSYDVKYVIDEPLPEGVIVPTGGSYKYKETVTLEPTPGVPGYTFIGWETEDVTLSTGKFMMPTHDVTLKDGL